MAHMIDSMMYVGETPWHKLGTALDKPPTTEEALLQAGLDWTVKKLPTYSPNLDNDEEYFGNHASMKTGHYHTWRIDRVKQPWELIKDSKKLVGEMQNAVLGSNAQINGDFINKRRRFTPLGPVSERYGVLQNKEAFEPFDILVDQGYTYETAGAIDEGRKVWILAKAPETTLVGDDILYQYILLYTSHDGSAGSTFRITDVRTVCKNTLDIALKGNGSAYALKHNSNIKNRIDELKTKLVKAQGNVQQAIDDMNRMYDFEINGDQLNMYLELCIPFLKTRHKESVPELGIKIRNNAKIAYDKMVHNFYSGRGNNGKTLWDAYNAVTEYYTHEDRYQDNWVKKTQFGKAYNYKVTALRVAQKMVESTNTTMVTA